MKIYLKSAEQIFAFLSLMFYSDAILILVLSNGAGQADVEVTYNTFLYRTCAFLVYVLTFFLLALRWKKQVHLLKRDTMILLLLFLPLLSLLWSHSHLNTLKDSITLLGSSMFGIYLASRYTLKQQLKFLGLVFGVSIILCPIFAIALPQYGIIGNAWRGIYLHKNGLGASMALSVIIFLSLATSTNNKQ